MRMMGASSSQECDQNVNWNLRHMKKSRYTIKMTNIDTQHIIEWLLPEGIANRFPAWGSAWKNPFSSICFSEHCTSVSTNLLLSSPIAAILARSLSRAPSTHSIVSTLLVDSAVYTFGTNTVQRYVSQLYLISCNTKNNERNNAQYTVVLYCI